MLATKQPAIETFMEMVKKRNADQPEFHRAVYEVALAVIPFIEKHPE